MTALAQQGYEFGGVNPRELGLWSTAAAVIVSVHVAAAWYVQSMPAAALPMEQAQAAVMIDLAPMALAPEAVPQDMANLVESAASDLVEEVTEQAEPVTPETAEPVAEPVEEVAAAEPEPVEEIAEAQPVEEVIPDLVELPLPEVAMAIPQPRPAVEKPKPEAKPVQKKPVARKPVEDKPVEKPVKQAEQKKPQERSAASRKSAHASDKTQASNAGSGATQSMSPAQWRARVQARMARHQPKFRKTGLVTVRFTFNESGDILSASLLQASGVPEIDQAALRLVRRASPIPAPPPTVPSYLDLPMTFK